MQIGLDWTAGGGFEQKKWFSNQCASARRLAEQSGTCDGRLSINKEPELEVLSCL